MASTRQEALGDLQKFQWCRTLLDDPSWVRLGNRANMGDFLFCNALWNDQTLRAHVSLYKAPPPNQSESGEVRQLLSLGSGVEGWPGVCHGGFLLLLIDDAIHELARKDIPSPSATVTMSSTFKRPVKTPAVVLLRAWMERQPEGRKVWINATIEDGVGGVFLVAKALCVKQKAGGL